MVQTGAGMVSRGGEKIFWGAEMSTKLMSYLSGGDFPATLTGGWQDTCVRVLVVKVEGV